MPYPGISAMHFDYFAKFWGYRSFSLLYHKIWMMKRTYFTISALYYPICTIIIVSALIFQISNIIMKL